MDIRGEAETELLKYSGHNERTEHAESAVAHPDRIERYRITRILGRGGFGTVFLAFDEQLMRQVAIKVPFHKKLPQTDGPSRLTEARIVAGLDHPNIAPIYDVGSTDDHPLYFVTKYVDGMDLKKRVLSADVEVNMVIEWVASIADAAHYAHKKGVIHRDIKPQNILIDRNSIAYLVDFGLAIDDSLTSTGFIVAGTPAYMSPEQIRGEGHRVDGRTDIFSLGIVLYELLTGRVPFSGADRGELFAEILHREVKPLRQLNDRLPKELDHICQRAVAKRASDRYSTAMDFAEELRSVVLPRSNARLEGGPTALDSSRESKAISSSVVDNTPIVPKGLRSFDQLDSEFYMRLVPGPRDRHGMPECLRFWKHRIESNEPDASFSVGVLYGPSGCGKSSLVKAGLIPRLSENIQVVFVEATSINFEQRLLNALQRVLPNHCQADTLKTTLSKCRTHTAAAGGKQLLIVLDQFEQWLYERHDHQNTELIDALRQCDGVSVKAMIIVRDDFWLSLSRFMRELEVPLLEGRNCALADLFSKEHARRVLALYGQAYEKLSIDQSQWSREQSLFIRSSVDALAKDDKVICVQLALFAEMMKSRSWTRAGLREIGGIEGLGRKYLEEVFHGNMSGPHHRAIEGLAERILSLLLPDHASHLKGNRRSKSELRELCKGFGSPNNFDSALQTVEQELKLVTSVDAESAEENATSPDSSLSTAHDSQGPWYQLSHDYLVPSIRSWALRKQKATRRGRAELLLNERSEQWGVKSDSRLLPSIFEYLVIQAWVPSHQRTTAQKRMLRNAGIYYLARCCAAAMVALLAMVGFWRWYDHTQTAFTLQRLQTSQLIELGPVLEQLRTKRSQVEKKIDQLAQSPQSSQRIHALLAKLTWDKSAFPILSREIVTIDPANASGVGLLAKRYGPYDASDAWKVLESPSLTHNQFLNLVCLLAYCDPENSQWNSDNTLANIVSRLLSTSPVEAADWGRRLQVISHKLAPRLWETVKADIPTTDATRRQMAIEILAEYWQRDNRSLVDLVPYCERRTMDRLLPTLENSRSESVSRLRALLQEDKLAHEKRKLETADRDIASTDLRNRLQEVGGSLEKGYAFCTRLPLGALKEIIESLSNMGYRPTRIRPYVTTNGPMVAAVWTCDHKPFRYAIERSTAQLEELNQQYVAEQFCAVDVYGMTVKSPKFDTQTNRQENYSATWVQNDSPGYRSSMIVGALEAQWADRSNQAALAGLSCTTSITSSQDEYGQTRISAIRSNRSASGVQFIFAEPLETIQAREYLGSVAWDVNARIRNDDEDNSASPSLLGDSLWIGDATMSSRKLIGLDADDHQRDAGLLIQEGFQPVSISACYLADPGTVEVSSVWHRKRPSERELKFRTELDGRAILGMWRLGSDESLIEALSQTEETDLRTFLIHSAKPFGIEPHSMLESIERIVAVVQSKDESVGQDRCLKALSDMLYQCIDQIQSEQRELASSTMARVAKCGSHSGVIASAKRFLDGWERSRESPSAGTSTVRNQLRFPMVRIDPQTFLMGSPPHENRRQSNEMLHRCRITHPYLIAATETSMSDFREFASEFPEWRIVVPVDVGSDPNCPQGLVSWFAAAAYCNWRSRCEGLPEVFVRNADGKYDYGMKVSAEAALHGGYRLPTEAEWELACRSGSQQSYSFGSDRNWASYYAWTAESSESMLHPVGSLLSNDLGLYDMHGNVQEWTLQEAYSYPGAIGVAEDLVKDSELIRGRTRILRGGAYSMLAPTARAAYRHNNLPDMQVYAMGFRVARTIVEESER